LTGVQFSVGTWIFLFASVGDQLHPAFYPVCTKGLSAGVKRPRLDADHSSSANAELRMRGAISPSPHKNKIIIIIIIIIKISLNNCLRFILRG
jgi:hypothetical protein